MILIYAYDNIYQFRIMLHGYEYGYDTGYDDMTIFSTIQVSGDTIRVSGDTILVSIRQYDTYWILVQNHT